MKATLHKTHTHPHTNAHHLTHWTAPHIDAYIANYGSLNKKTFFPMIFPFYFRTTKGNACCQFSWILFSVFSIFFFLQFPASLYVLFHYGHAGRHALMVAYHSSDFSTPLPATQIFLLFSLGGRLKSPAIVSHGLWGPPLFSVCVTFEFIGGTFYTCREHTHTPTSKTFERHCIRISLLFFSCMA